MEAQIPRNGSGVYSKPVPSVEPNTTIASAVFNAVVDDLANDNNTARPVSAGGTGASSAAAARANLDVAGKQSGTTDATPGAGLIVGAFGLGGNAPTQATPDTAGLFTGFMREGQAAGDDIRMRVSASAAEMFDLVAVPSTEKLHFRGMTGGVWGALRQIFHQGSILGTVAQSGGVPTGALFEETTSPAGEYYIRFASGLQVAMKNNATLGFLNVAALSYTWSLAKAFTSVYWGAVSLSPASADYTNINSRDLDSGGRCGSGTSSLQFSVASPTGVTVQADSTVANCRLIAIGRWF